jgi:hypothetical protein
MVCNFFVSFGLLLSSFFDLPSDFIFVTLCIHCVWYSLKKHVTVQLLLCIILLFISVTSGCVNMAQEHTVSFKVFLQNEGANEVRRFGIDRDVVSSFNYLREKLRVVFPSLHGCDFTVAWRGNQNCNYFYNLRATGIVKWCT